ncbi:helix-turn-helix domain-containing protein [Nocardia sp. bgisy118]|uniref:helix-turn-helix domain-containing protein n=1 Tax=Nocardia sp. bgisy118 TaxID=3413786 RepID=UPI003F49CC54
MSSIARLLGVSRSTLYKYVPELGKQLAAGEDRQMPDGATDDEPLPSHRATGHEQHPRGK